MAGAEFYCFLKVLQSFFVLALAAAGNSSVVIAVCKNRVESDGSVEILLGTPYVAEIVFSYAPEEEIPVIGGVKPSQDVEILYGIGEFAVRQGLSSAKAEYILVVLCAQFSRRTGSHASQKEYCQSELFH